MAMSPAFDSGARPNLPLEVKGRTLLIMMITAPLGIVAALIDAYIFNNALRDYAFNNPERVVWWVAVLSTPHIIASLVTFADREYISLYAKPLKKGVLIAVLLGLIIPVAVGMLLNPGNVPYTDIGAMAHFGAGASLLIAALYTTYHNLQQQYGVALMLMKQPATFIHHLWKWITIIPATLVFLGMQYNHEGLDWEYWPNVKAIAAVSMALAVIVAGRIAWQYTRRPDWSHVGLAFFGANAAMLVISFGLVLKGYILIAMLMPRVIHDLTAYWVYMVHDENRNATTMRNPIYALPAKIGIRPVWFCVPLSFIIGYALLVLSQDMFVLTFFVLSLNYIHYYLEGIIWKRGSPHRQHVPFT
ncbi:MAG: hypothetical protein EBQ96_01745 [Proteobacteria bacterium]|nr:hypothetical protein [Pseudomonadota bacterium]